MLNTALNIKALQIKLNKKFIIVINYYSYINQ
jgi:hypothetical protein